MLEKGYRSRSRRGSGQGEECLMDTRFKRLRCVCMHTSSEKVEVDVRK